MKIETKYDIEQTVWIHIQDHGISSYTIKQIQVRNYYGEMLVEYAFSNHGNALRYGVGRLHLTKEACEAAA